MSEENMMSEKKVYSSGQMENKYKNEIPNIILDDAHLNCASIPFIVMKWFGKTMPVQRPSFEQDSNNASIKSDQASSRFCHWTVAIDERIC